jgi:hypothetical protein
LSKASISATYTDAQTDAVLVTAGLRRLRVSAVVVAVSDAVSVPVNMVVQLGSQIVFRHPGAPPGGGASAIGLDIAAPSAGQDITVTCGVPTGGACTFNVVYDKA